MNGKTGLGDETSRVDFFPAKYHQGKGKPFPYGWAENITPEGLYFD